MGDHSEIMKSLSQNQDGITYACLTPNLKGLQSALSCGAKEVVRNILTGNFSPMIFYFQIISRQFLVPHQNPSVKRTSIAQ